MTSSVPFGLASSGQHPLPRVECDGVPRPGVVPHRGTGRTGKGDGRVLVAVTTTAVIAVLALVAAATLLTIVLVRRVGDSGPDRDHELVRAVDEMRMKMDALSQDLSQALDRAERESRRNRLFGELGGSIDLEELMDRVLDAAMQIPGFDAAMIVVEGQTGAPTVVTRGMTPQETTRPPTSGVVGALPWTMTVTYRYGRDRQPPDAELICGGVFIPLIGRELAAIGTLSLFWRSPEHEPQAEQLEQAEGLVEGAIPAIENARRYGEARKEAETDALTGLYNQRYFHETLRREVLRAQRYERNLALILFDVDDFKSINDQIGHLAGDRVLAQAAERLREAVRSVDVPCRVGGDEFAVILPESNAIDADQLYRRVQSSMRGTSLGPDDDRLRLSAGIAELQHGDTAAGLFERADAALYRAKDLGKDRADIARLPE
jgi:diguanylate cyclase (GGDEF)-like protein